MTALHPAFLARPIAHRALHNVADGRPENSRAAIAAAMAHGYGIEIDLQLSADGVAMVFHDYELDRLTFERGPVHLRTAGALQQTTLRGGAQGIPALADVLEQVAGRVPLLIEIKDQDGAMGDNVGALEAATAAELARYEGPVAVMSFNPHSVAEMARIAPDIARGITTCSYDPKDWPLLPASRRDALRDIPDFDAVGASFISHEARDLSRDRVQDLRDAGTPILCWTIRSPAAEAEARKIAQNVTFETYLPA
ncbi:Glycerophosphoryl diester phosphodiesterase [Poseidonocella pacifica]|uniref:Glycerophosphoryl diester phosphodiesterase n=1 Tax=Poseidonocella pacifica TaxID=871651 RepID=A0A1I0Y2U2_9RHOB|nr:glycerophosphodiester phosphodiesterase family protein [Poseidonocella pacifica]SFB06523.1 Glycerophosphoryl diester phosphodiesterase [Poseidonocella pacifica]